MPLVLRGPSPSRSQLTRAGFQTLPSLIARAGERASWRFVEFFTATIRNRNTRAAYAQALGQFFAWCDSKRIAGLGQLNPVFIAAYIEGLQEKKSAPSVKQHLAAIRMLFDFLVVGQVLPMNPASSVRGPRHVVKRGKTPVLKSEQARQLIDAIKIKTIVGLRDRAIVGVMVYTFARVSATVHMEVGDYYQSGKRWWIRLHEKGGKRHEVPCHHNLELYIDEYLAAAGIGEQRRSPLFRSVDKHRGLTDRPITRSARSV